MRSCVTAVLIGVMVGVLRADAEDFAPRVQFWEHPSGPDPYSGWISPEGVSCCGARDCAPVPLCLTADRRVGWAERGRCWPLPEDREQPAAPTEIWDLGELHVCRQWQADGTPRVLCWALRGSV